MKKTLSKSDLADVTSTSNEVKVTITDVIKIKHGKENILTKKRNSTLSTENHPITDLPVVISEASGDLALVEASGNIGETFQTLDTAYSGDSQPGMLLAQASSGSTSAPAASTAYSFPAWGWVAGVVSVGAISSKSSPGSTNAPKSVTGTAIDGYLMGADVYVVSGGQKTKVGTTDANGKFTIQNPTGALIQVEGGTNKDTGLPNTVVLKAPSSADGTMVVTPLTTLIHTKMVELGVSAQAAEATVREKLGITGNVNLLTLDSIATENVAVQKANVLIATAIKQADSAAEADLILKDLSSAFSSATGKIDLTNTLITVLEDKVPASVLNALQDQLTVIETAANISEIGSKQKDAVETLEKVEQSATGGNVAPGGGGGGGSDPAPVPEPEMPEPIFSVVESEDGSGIWSISIENGTESGSVSISLEKIGDDYHINFNPTEGGDSIKVALANISELVVDDVEIEITSFVLNKLIEAEITLTSTGTVLIPDLEKIPDLLTYFDNTSVKASIDFGRISDPTFQDNLNAEYGTEDIDGWEINLDGMSVIPRAIYTLYVDGDEFNFEFIPVDADEYLISLEEGTTSNDYLGIIASGLATAYGEHASVEGNKIIIYDIDENIEVDVATLIEVQNIGNSEITISGKGDLSLIDFEVNENGGLDQFSSALVIGDEAKIVLSDPTSNLLGYDNDLSGLSVSGEGNIFILFTGMVNGIFDSSNLETEGNIKLIIPPDGNLWCIPDSNNIDFNQIKEIEVGIGTTLWITSEQADGINITGDGATIIEGSDGSQEIHIGSRGFGPPFGYNFIYSGKGIDEIHLGNGSDIVVVEGGSVARDAEPSSATVQVNDPSNVSSISFTLGGELFLFDHSSLADATDLNTLINAINENLPEGAQGIAVSDDGSGQLLFTDALGRGFSSDDFALMTNTIIPATPSTVTVVVTDPSDVSSISFTLGGERFLFDHSSLADATDLNALINAINENLPEGAQGISVSDDGSGQLLFIDALGRGFSSYDFEVVRSDGETLDGSAAFIEGAPGTLESFEQDLAATFTEVLEGTVAVIHTESDAPGDATIPELVFGFDILNDQLWFDEFTLIDDSLVEDVGQSGLFTISGWCTLKGSWALITLKQNLRSDSRRF
jgi:hypothetical protein